MADTWTLFASGCVFGLSGGFSPGPTTTLIVSQTLRFGVFDGLKVAIAPLLTDAPIIIASVLLVEQLSRFTPVLGVITLLGACFLAYLAIDSFRTREVEVAESDVEPRSISKGFMVNLMEEWMSEANIELKDQLVQQLSCVDCHDTDPRR